MKKSFILVAIACFLLYSFLPVITVTKGPGHVIGHWPLWVVYPGLAYIIREGNFRNFPIALLWVGIHLFLTIASAWIIVRIWTRRMKSRQPPVV